MRPRLSRRDRLYLTGICAWAATLTGAAAYTWRHRHP